MLDRNTKAAITNVNVSSYKTNYTFLLLKYVYIGDVD